MADEVKITDRCVACGTCEPVCPVGAISKPAGSDQFMIDPDTCIRCCGCIGVCPVGAIEEE